MSSVTLHRIKQVTADHFGLTLAELESARRFKHIVRPRQIALYCATRLTSHSLPTIAKHFGNKDHTTVLHARNHIAALLSKDSDVGKDVASISAVLEDQEIDPEIIARQKKSERLKNQVEALQKNIKSKSTTALKAQKRIDKFNQQIEQLCKEIDELQLEVRSHRAEIKELQSLKLKIKQANNRVFNVVAASAAYEQARYSIGELEAFNALLKACAELRDATPLSQTQ